MRQFGQYLLKWGQFGGKGLRLGMGLDPVAGPIVGTPSYIPTFYLLGF